MDKRPALGKGLSALIPDAPEPPPVATIEADIDRLMPNDFQPRLGVSDDRLQELAQSIRANGVIQPIVVRKHGDRFQIIAGERRWRASKIAGLPRVPIVVKEVAPGHEQSLLEMALIENIQREDLNPIEEALAYRRLADEFHLKQEEIAAAVGKDRASVANCIRLLKLPEEVRAEVASGRLTMGHARALLSLSTDADQRRVGAEAGGRPHAGRRRSAEAAPRHARAHRPQRRARPHRDRFRVRGRVDQDLRAAHGAVTRFRIADSREEHMAKRLTQMVACAG
jgi:ParB family chromosome partitioning protein